MGNRYPSVTRILNKYTDFSRVPAHRLQAAADKGKRVHAVCASIAQGNFAAYEDDIAGYVKSFERWMDTIKPNVLLVEQELVSDIYQFMGHPDLVIEWEDGIGKIGVIDLKTPQIISKTWEPQIAAYTYLADAYLETSCTKNGFLRLSPKGDMPRFTQIRHIEGLAVFFNALAAHNYLYEEGVIDDGD